MYVTEFSNTLLDMPVIYKRDADNSPTTSTTKSSASSSSSSSSTAQSSPSTTSGSSSSTTSSSSPATGSSSSKTDSSSSSSTALSGTTVSFSVSTTSGGSTTLPSGSSISFSGASSSKGGLLLTLPTIDQGYTIPTVTVPMMDNNPYIHRDRNPSGTVFIAIGSIMGFALLIALFLWIYTIVANRMNASNGYFNNFSKSGILGFGSPLQSKEGTFSGNAGGNGDYPLEKQQYANFLNGSDAASTVLSQHGGASITLSAINTNNLSHTYTNVSGNPFSEASFMTHGGNSSMMLAAGGYEDADHDLNKNTSTDKGTLAINNAASNNNNRTSMYISPTAELLNKRNLHTSMVDGFDATTTNDLSNVVSSENNNPQSQHVKSESLSYPQKANISVSSVNLTTGRKGRTTPSMYLENMFDQSSNTSSN